MPRSGPVRQILENLTVSELRDIKNDLCPRVEEYDGDKDQFIGSIRDSAKRSMNKGELTYGELFSTIREAIEDHGPKHATTRIRNSIRDLEISENAQNADTTGVRENWISSELFQCLRKNLQQTQYEVEQEARFGRSAVDLLIGDGSRNYIIELKLAGNASSRDKLPSQVAKYRKKVPNMRKAFAVIITEKERHLPENKNSVQHIVDQTESESKTEVIIKGPDAFR